MGYPLGFAAAPVLLLPAPAGRARLDHLWAEDGARFMVDAVTSPALSNVVTPYGGYLHALPRLVAELVALLPLEWAAAGFAVSRPCCGRVDLVRRLQGVPAVRARGAGRGAARPGTPSR